MSAAKFWGGRGRPRMPDPIPTQEQIIAGIQEAIAQHEGKGSDYLGHSSSVEEDPLMGWFLNMEFENPAFDPEDDDSDTFIRFRLTIKRIAPTAPE